MRIAKHLMLVLCLAGPWQGLLGQLRAQSQGSMEGQVTLAETGASLRGVSVLVLELGRTVVTDAEGRYRFDRVPEGFYQVLAHLDSTLTEEAKGVAVTAQSPATLNFTLAIAVQEYEITVTAGGKEETAFESFQTVDSQTSFDLAESTAPAIGDVLASRPGNGVAKRSFGPGSSRPIIRGFDGDRVLVMQDGIRTGTLSSQSGDHGELINASTLDRLEVVKGPATLLYGSNALGGVVNAVTRHHAVHEHPHAGLRGYVSGSAGSANAFGGGSAGFEYGHGKWLLWGGGASQRSADYNTPQGPVFNSKTRVVNSYGGFGWYGDKTFASFNAQADDGAYGVPFAAQFEGGEEGVDRIQIDSRRESYQANWGLRKLGWAIEGFTLKLNLTNWEHDEVEFFKDGEREVGTTFDQKQFVYRGVFEQAKRGQLTGRFGFWGLVRDYDVAGAEALSPPVDQDALAVFALEEIDFERFKLQFGGRLERTHYAPGMSISGAEQPTTDYPDRSFTGASGAAGVRADVWRGGALVVNYAHSFRAPALEELYNFGPHLGSLAFEVGDLNLGPETGDGVEVSLRQKSKRARGELNLFYYGFNNFVFPFATGEFEDGLQVINFTQLDSRFAGAEANLSLALNTNVWFNLGMDYVDAQETNFNTPLPRIPPLRGRVGFDFRYQALSVKPELVLASDQQQTFTGETRTPGYAVVNLKASYTIPQGRLVHQFAVNLFNIGDRLYRNHSSFIKDLAPEIGRGVRFTYRIRFF